METEKVYHADDDDTNVCSKHLVHLLALEMAHNARFLLGRNLV